VKYDSQLSKVFNKNKLKTNFWNNGAVNTPYNRIIQSDEHHVISYLNQSTFIDLFHRQIIKVDDFLQNKQSFIAFMIHDELVLDVTEEEKRYLIDIIKILQDTAYGTFPVNVKAGKNFGDMKKLNLKV
jgi:DNA polymerase I-like protein with 3'-5' exonuclease and polymerase domains